jgi:hypothetical protein
MVNHNDKQKVRPGSPLPVVDTSIRLRDKAGLRQLFCSQSDARIAGVADSQLKVKQSSTAEKVKQ